MASSGKGLISMPQDHFSANRIADMPSAVQSKLVGDDGTTIPDSDSEFDASQKPPFTLGQIRAAVPKHCWERNMVRSLSYFARDVVIVTTFAVVAGFVDSWLLWVVYWLAQGTMFMALFVLGHDCGHQAFSSSKTVNNMVGHVVLTFILVPYHGFRISHRIHHSNHGHIERDETWYPVTESVYKAPAESIFNIDFWRRFSRLQVPLQLIVFPGYLWTRGPGKTGSHYNPSSPLFDASDWLDVTLSTSCWLTMAGSLVWASSKFGFLWMLKLYFVPYLISVLWLDAVTYLHHHGYEKKVPWYRGQEWNFLRGGLSTIDRDYGVFNKVHHDIGTHVVHHLFPVIPHYHLCEATEAVKPLLGKYYREPEKSGAVPLHLLPILLKSLSEDHFVPDEGDVVFYQKDTKSH